jgi:glyoxylase-like metal-dependent hydrolase (beta-lactamase superfamily II)
MDEVGNNLRLCLELGRSIPVYVNVKRIVGADGKNVNRLPCSFPPGMNPLESQLDYAFGDTLPSPGFLLEVAPGVRWLRMGLPFALDHINLWLLEDEQDGRAGWTIVDCGIANDATRAAWEKIFATGLDGKPVLRVIATHCHPDHVGLSDWLCSRWDAPLWMTTGEYAFARMMAASLPGVDGTAMLPHFQRHGLVDPAMLEALQGRRSYYPTLVPAVPASYRRIQDGQEFRIGRHDWKVITGFGHAPEHASLYCAGLKLLISGDMVLPRISTNVSVFAVEPEANPVQLYLDSLKKYAGLPDDTLVLPSHGKPFRGLHIRISQLDEHHRERLAEVIDACVTPQSAADIVPVMFRRKLDAHQLTFALGEALAHLHKLWFDGTLRRDIGADGVIRFVRQAESTQAR